MPAVVVDTDVVSFTFKRDSRALLYGPHIAHKILLISFMTVAELLVWPIQRKWGAKRKSDLAKHLKRFAVHFADRKLCERWAEVRAYTEAIGRPIQVADAWIAATALVHHLPLVTHNASHFANVRG